VPFIARNDVSALPRRFCDHDIFREAARTDLEKFADEVDLSVHRRRVRCIENFPPKTCSLHLLAHTTKAGSIVEDEIGNCGCSVQIPHCVIWALALSSCALKVSLSGTCGSAVPASCPASFGALVVVVILRG
jgi:hypothetical protein